MVRDVTYTRSTRQLRANQKENKIKLKTVSLICRYSECGKPLGENIVWGYHPNCFLKEIDSKLEDFRDIK